MNFRWGAFSFYKMGSLIYCPKIVISYKNLQTQERSAPIAHTPVYASAIEAPPGAAVAFKTAPGN